MEENQKAWAEPGRPVARPEKQESVLRDINVNVRCSCCGDTQKQLQEILERLGAIEETNAEILKALRDLGAAKEAETVAVIESKFRPVLNRLQNLT